MLFQSYSFLKANIWCRQFDPATSDFASESTEEIEMYVAKVYFSSLLHDTEYYKNFCNLFFMTERCSLTFAFEQLSTIIWILFFFSKTALLATLNFREKILLQNSSKIIFFRNIF